jgi:peptidoglycan hydrolase-like protein with peptidoglycan-binding domain
MGTRFPRSPGFARSFSKSKKEEETIMKSLHYIVLVSLLSLGVLSVHGQASTSSRKVSDDDTKTAPSKRGPVFRANKDQVTAAQTMLKRKGAYSGDATGKLDAATRDALKTYQKDNGLRATGTLNRATLEKMGIALTEQQKAIPVSKNSFASEKSSGIRKPRGAVFRATKDQIAEAQRLLKSGGMYSGSETGKLDDPTRESLKKYQEAHGIKATGTLNQVTLEKMGIELTDRQKSSDAGQKGSDDSD